MKTDYFDFTSGEILEIVVYKDIADAMASHRSSRYYFTPKYSKIWPKTRTSW